MSSSKAVSEPACLLLNGHTPGPHGMECERDLIKDTREISRNDVPPLSDLVKGGINVRPERRLRLAVSSHVSKGSDQALTTVTRFDKE